MNKNVVLALIAGLLGGMLTRYVAAPSAYAQNQVPPPTAPVSQEIRSQSFTLVDQSNRIAGTFSVAPDSRGRLAPPRIVLRDVTGREIWSAGGSGFQPLTAR
jgi:hypothetical protein